MMFSSGDCVLYRLRGHHLINALLILFCQLCELAGLFLLQRLQDGFVVTLGGNSSWWFLRALYCLFCTLHVSWNCFLICISNICNERSLMHHTKAKYNWAFGFSIHLFFMSIFFPIFYVSSTYYYNLCSLPWGSWAAVGVPVHASCEAPSGVDCCTPPGSPTQFDAGGASAQSLAFVRFVVAVVPALGWTHPAWSSMHAPFLFVSSSC